MKMKESMSHPYKFQLIPTVQIKVNTLYQRALNMSRVKKLVRSFDWHLVNPIKVVWHNGEWVAVDGQHTLFMLRAKFGDNYLAPCLVYEDVDDWFQQAEIFLGMNNKELRKVLSIRDTWKARLFSNESKASTIAQICKEYGLTIPTESGNSGKGYVSAIGALERAYDDLDAAQFTNFLYILTKAWDGDKTSLTAPIISGLSRFVKIYYGEYNRTNLIRRLHRTEPELIVRAGKASAATGQNKYAREILNVYNKSTTSGRLVDKLG